MEKITLRPFRDSDQGLVWKLHVEGLNQTGSFIFNPELDADFENIKAAYLDKGGEFLVASFQGSVIGMGAFRKVDEGVAEIKRMRVTPAFQRQGIGGQILERLIQKATILGYRKLILDTSEKQTAAQRLYEKYGFQEYQKKKLGEHDILYYSMNLKQSGGAKA